MVKQIDKDLDRTFADQRTRLNTAEGKRQLRNVLGAYSTYCKKIGYCQSMNFVAGHLLLHADEELAFYMLIQICENRVQGYYSRSLDGLQARAASSPSSHLVFVPGYTIICHASSIAQGSSFPYQDYHMLCFLELKQAPFVFHTRLTIIL